ncbi:zinc-binding dehydrogenase [Ligilactobacillus murinus]|uniref:zinc-binding dehydrogenase n=1 Tax=Ligilactobacillus murinus TaxID=1622 RepID=UPI001D1602E4|nr:zinc-binding dehydrogenase [Ligilactobacillus murinus]WRY38916.1 zinc-binding dehydrogenase [Ligilactobacillus murinus]
MEVLTTVSTAKKDFVKAFHPAKIIDYKQEDVTKAVLEYTDGQGVDLIINTVGSKEAKLDLTKRLAYNGELVCLVEVPKVDDPTWLFENGLSLSALNLGGAHGR